MTAEERRAWELLLVLPLGCAGEVEPDPGRADATYDAVYCPLCDFQVRWGRN